MTMSEDKQLIKDYFSILEPEFPDWLNRYINTKEMQRLKYISTSCGTIYSKLYNDRVFYSTLDHSVAVALIIWHFTFDKKQTLAGLFHDIATPVFKHCIDFLRGDYLLQESTENETRGIIENSKEIMQLLESDLITVDEVCDYKIYPIADNEKPKLSADRLEYSLSDGLFRYGLLNLNDVKRIYQDIEIEENEQNEKELAFSTKKIAREFVKVTSNMSVIYREDRTRYSMQLLADIVKRLYNDRLLSLSDLYTLKEKDVIELIKSSKYSKIFDVWQNAKKIKTSQVAPKGVYFVHVKAKVRYINPLVKNKRIYDICMIAKRMIDKNLAYDMSKYVYLDIDFT